MSTKYTFFDTDYYGHEEYDIAGREYIKLIEACCNYCCFLSLRICKDSCNLVDDLEKYRYKGDDVKFDYHYSISSMDAEDCVRYYRICPEIKEFLLKNTHSIMSFVSTWDNNNPEDPVFYREDGSVFFSSVIHEGICTLYPLEHENIDSIVSNPLWHLTKQGIII